MMSWARSVRGERQRRLSERSASRAFGGRARRLLDTGQEGRPGAHPGPLSGGAVDARDLSALSTARCASDASCLDPAAWPPCSIASPRSTNSATYGRPRSGCTTTLTSGSRFWQRATRDSCRVSSRNDRSIASKARKPLLDNFFRRAADGEVRWNVTLFPTEAHAMDASMSLDEYEDFYYGACLVDHEDPVGEWRKMAARHEKLIEWMKGRNEVRIEGEGTDLTLEVGGRIFLPADGLENFPDGEIFTGPIERQDTGPHHVQLPGDLWGQVGRGHPAGVRRGPGRRGDGRQERGLPHQDPGHRSGSSRPRASSGSARTTGSTGSPERSCSTRRSAGPSTSHVRRLLPRIGGQQRVRGPLGHGLRPPYGGPDHGRRRRPRWRTASSWSDPFLTLLRQTVVPCPFGPGTRPSVGSIEEVHALRPWFARGAVSPRAGRTWSGRTGTSIRTFSSSGRHPASTRTARHPLRRRGRAAPGQTPGRRSASIARRSAIVNVVKCRPPGNRDPLPDEIEACRPYSRPSWTTCNRR